MIRLTSLLLTALILIAGCASDDDGAVADDAAASDAAATATPTAESEPEAAVDDDLGTVADTDQPVQGGEITYGLSDNGTGFDTTEPILPGALRIIAAMNDPLVAMDENGQWQPNLAESLTPNEDATVWTIRLRPDITFHDGAAVDAAAVKANIDAFRAAAAVGFGLADIESVNVVDPLTVDVIMKRPWFAFPNQLVGQAGYMVSPASIGTNDDFVGVGPFVLDSWVPGDSARVVANPNYWRSDEGFPYLDSIMFKVIPEANSRRQALEAGDIDM